MLYRERGQLDFVGYADEVTREYRYAFGERHHARVNFVDGRPFHGLDLRTGAAHVEHICGEDIYDGAFTVDSADRWRVVWRVSGPRKSLTLASVYTRADQLPP